MDVLAIARWQFGITTVYHFLMVPLTIGLAVLVAGMQTAWVRTGDRKYYAMTKFWGKLLLINFAMGVVTGLVQEFQFGMNWSSYSRFVGDVFGAPLAMEGIVAFFIESTFLGLWIFGWDRLPKRVHLGCAWAFSLATIASSYFILAANSWMQHPVGIKLVHGRPVLTSIWAVLTNPTLMAALPHTVAGCFAVGATFLVGVAVWHLFTKETESSPTSNQPEAKLRFASSVTFGRIGIYRHSKSHRSHKNETESVRADRAVWRASLKLGAWVGIIAFAAVAISGDQQGKLMFQQQPMKMAAAEALCHTEQPASFSVLAVGDVAKPDCNSVKSLDLPYVLSFLATGDFTSKVQGVQELIPQYQAKYGTNYPNDPALGALAGKPIDYVPDLPVTYWGFRLMIGFGVLAALAAAGSLWLTRRGRFPKGRAGRLFAWLALFGIATPFLANSFGWIFTEMGRQPWVVAPNPVGIDGVWMYTAQAVSSGVTVGEALTSVITLTAVYACLAVIEAVVMVRYVRGGLAGVLPPDDHGDAPDAKSTNDDVLAFAY